MYNRNIFIVLGLVFCLGIFFQYNRADGFTRLISNMNATMLPSGVGAEADEEKKKLAKERFLLIYNPVDVQSMFLRHQVEAMLREQKKEVVLASDQSHIDWRHKYDAVLLATGDLERLADFEQMRQYVRDGGKLACLMHFVPGGRFASWFDEIGVRSAESQYIFSLGVRTHTDFLFGAKEFTLKDTKYMTEVLPLSLSDDVTVHASTLEGIPLVWEKSVQNGKVILYNGARISEKISSGLLTAMISHTKSTYVYPIVNVKLFFIDDFPSPEPEGNYEKIYNEFHLSTSEFYREVWWPDMLSLAERYGVKYTGLIIETYRDHVTPPFNPEAGGKAKKNLVIYGRELLKAGGELGIHGYNHQPLALEGYAPEKLGYVAWPNKEMMIESLKELQRYIREVYPEYEIRVYVPPSNVLSPLGKEALQEVFPTLKIFSSLHTGALEDNGYYQPFARNSDGTYELPRVTSGFVLSDDMKWESINVLNAKGIASHFVHPDELFYEESKALSWKMMKEGFEDNLSNLEKKYGWLRAGTASQGARFLDEYINLDYRLEEKNGKLYIYSWGVKENIYFILRTERKVKSVQGGAVQDLGDDVYLLETNQSEAVISFKDGEDA